MGDDVKDAQQITAAFLVRWVLPLVVAICGLRWADQGAQQFGGLLGVEVLLYEGVPGDAIHVEGAAVRQCVTAADK